MNSPEARCPAGLKYRCAVAAAAFLVTVATPLAIDLAAGEIAWHTAYAGNGDGNFGNGKGNGGANGQDPGKNGQNKGGNDDGNDGNNDNADSPAPDTTDDAPQYLGGDTSEADEMADNEVSQSIEAVGGFSAEGPVAGMPAAGLPTISQLFSLGDDATISAEEELQLISNGWKSN